MSSKFSSPFFQKSPLYGAYTSGADAVFAVSDAPHFAKLQNDLLGGVLASDKKDPCQKLEDRYSSGVITKQRYMDGLKNCAKTSKKEKEIDRGGLPEGYGGAQTQAGYDYFNMKENSVNPSGSSSGIDPNTGMGFRSS